MASGYALPHAGEHNHSRGHQAFPSLDGAHTEHSIHEHHGDHGHSTADGLTHKAHTHTFSHPQQLPTNGLFRGGFDVSQMAADDVGALTPDTHSHSHLHVHVSRYDPSLSALGRATLTDRLSSWISLADALTGLLLPMPYLFASAAYSYSDTSVSLLPPSLVDAELGGTDGGEHYALAESVHGAARLVQACTLTSGTLLLVSILAQIRSSECALDRRKRSDTDLHAQASGLLSYHALRKMATSALSLGLLYYAALQLGGTKVGLLVLTASATGLVRTASSAAVLRAWTSRRAVVRCLGFASWSTFLV